MPGPFPKAGWIDASRQGSFLSQLGLSSQDAPTCLLLRQLQPSFQVARMAASFSADAIAAFLTRPDFQPLHQQVGFFWIAWLQCGYWLLDCSMGRMWIGVLGPCCQHKHCSG